MRRAALPLAIALGLVACRAADPQPVPPALNQDACAHCRMILSDERFASQIVTQLGDPLYFDDLSCLANHLRETPLAEGAAVFVADHQTREWIDARQAIYTRADAIAGPMGSHVIAHRSADTRAADQDAAGGTIVPLADVLPTLAAGGK